MNTAHKTDKEKLEYFDSPEELDKKIDKLAQQIKSSKHFVVFTGAGISTSAGVPDFRSGVNTVLPTGPGAWEREATGTTKKPLLRKPIESAIPTPCHMALVKLHEAGYLKFLISQNVDGLHRKSGFPATKLAELHGNTNLESCRNPNCLKEYLRDYDTCTSNSVHEHGTGTLCENCGQELYDTIINFGENLPMKELKAGFDHSAESDLCLVLGSSLRVTPAAHMPLRTAEKGGELVIVNLQATPLDKHALRINGFVDDVLIRLMNKLELSIPKFLLRRRVMIMKTEASKDQKKKGNYEIFIRGVDETGSPYTILTGMEASFTESKEKMKFKGPEPYRMSSTKFNMDKGSLKLDLRFQGHYGEPNLILDISLEALELNEPIYYLMEFDPETQEWVSNTRTSISK